MIQDGSMQEKLQEKYASQTLQHPHENSLVLFGTQGLESTMDYDPYGHCDFDNIIFYQHIS